MLREVLLLTQQIAPEVCPTPQEVLILAQLMRSEVEILHQHLLWSIASSYQSCGFGRSEFVSSEMKSQR